MLSDILENPKKYKKQYDDQIIKEAEEKATKKFEIEIQNKDDEIQRLKEELKKYKISKGD